MLEGRGRHAGDTGVVSAVTNRRMGQLWKQEGSPPLFPPYISGFNKTARNHSKVS